MKHTVLDAPDFGLLRVVFESAGETLVAESGAMVSKSASLKMATSMRGGFFAAAKRKLLGGESLFQNTYVAQAPGEELLLAPAMEGDVRHRKMAMGETFYLQSGNYLAHVGQQLALDSTWGGVKSFFSGMGFFMLKVQGPGDLFFTSYGAIHEVDVGPAGYRVDTGHIVGFTEGLEYEITKFGGFKGLFFSGEGLVCNFRGQGKVYLQTRNVPALASFLEPYRRVQQKSN
jgi:uncharacterized protein (TIGR00266 family)